MIISKLHLPLNDNNGVELTEVHAKLKRAIVKIFNGCTVTTGQGLWEDKGKIYDEPVAIYEIAHWGAEYKIKQFMELVHEYGARANQLAVYCVVDKHATIIDIVKPVNSRPSPSRPNTK
jgi:hypothetical protein